MNAEMIRYIQELHHFVAGQQKKIEELEVALNSLKYEVATLKNRPPIHVDSIQYSFDQLKVETLTGTLNIGLNPTDLQGIDELAINQQNIPPVMSPKEQSEAIMSIEDEIYGYLDTEMPQIYNNYIQQKNLQLNDSYLDFIRTDIKQQLPKIIENYLVKFSTLDRSSRGDSNINEKVIAQLKIDINNGVEKFLQNLKPEERSD